MDLGDGTGTEARFRTYAADLASVLGHTDRVRPFEDYCVGLLSAEGRKSVEPLAAVTAPERTAAQHQSLLHLVAQAPWSDQAVLRRVRERVLPSITRDEPILAWIVDDTGFPKKGHHSVGVARQYCGQLGKATPNNRRIGGSRGAGSVLIGDSGAVKRWVDSADGRCILDWRTV
jgi:SRSO17 transposase